MRICPTFFLAVTLFLAAGSGRAEEKKADTVKLPPATDRVIDYQSDIKPILTASCVACHGPEKQRAGLRLDSRDQALKGGNSGPVLKPGDAVNSRLLHVV